MFQCLKMKDDQGKYSSPLGFHIESGSKTHPYEQSFLGIVSGFSLTKVNIPVFFGRNTHFDMKIKINLLSSVNFLTKGK